MLQEENLEQSLLLASSIQNNFIKKNKRKNRGVKQAGFVVLYQTTMPSVVVELGFLTNKIVIYIPDIFKHARLSNTIYDVIFRQFYETLL